VTFAVARRHDVAAVKLDQRPRDGEPEPAGLDDELIAPPQEHGLARGEDHADARPRALRPGLHGSERRPGQSSARMRAPSSPPPARPAAALVERKPDSGSSLFTDSRGRRLRSVRTGISTLTAGAHRAGKWRHFCHAHGPRARAWRQRTPARRELAPRAVSRRAGQSLARTLRVARLRRKNPGPS
jgi:hypothetical protein